MAQPYYQASNNGDYNYAHSPPGSPVRTSSRSQSPAVHRGSVKEQTNSPPPRPPSHSGSGRPSQSGSGGSGPGSGSDPECARTLPQAASNRTGSFHSQASVTRGDSPHRHSQASVRSSQASLRSSQSSMRSSQSSMARYSGNLPIGTMRGQSIQNPGFDASSEDDIRRAEQESLLYSARSHSHPKYNPNTSTATISKHNKEKVSLCQKHPHSHRSFWFCFHPQQALYLNGALLLVSFFLQLLYFTFERKHVNMYPTGTALCTVISLFFVVTGAWKESLMFMRISIASAILLIVAACVTLALLFHDNAKHDGHKRPWYILAYQVLSMFLGVLIMLDALSFMRHLKKIGQTVSRHDIFRKKPLPSIKEESPDDHHGYSERV